MNSSKPSDVKAYLFKNFLFATAGGISLIIFLILLSIWRTGTNLVKGVGAIFNPAITTQVDISNSIVQQIQGVSELTTTVFVMDAVVPTSSERKIGEWVVGETKLLYIARGEVRAGVDLSEVDQDDITLGANKLEIHLPPPEILDSKIDINHSQVYDYDRGFLNLGPDVAPKLQTEAQRQTLAKVINTACNQRILEQANARAKLTLTQLLETTGYENVEVKITSPDGC
jgi:hypothetical protein